MLQGKVSKKRESVFAYEFGFCMFSVWLLHICIWSIVSFAD